MVGEFVSLGLMVFGGFLTIVGMALLANEVRRLEKTKDRKRKKLYAKINQRYFGRERPLSLDYWIDGINLFIETLRVTEWKSWRPFLLIAIGLATFIFGVFVY